MRRAGLMSTNVQFLGEDVPVKVTDSKSDYNVIFIYKGCSMPWDGMAGWVQMFNFSERRFQWEVSDSNSEDTDKK